MSTRRRTAPLAEPNNLRRPPAVGEELKRLVAAAAVAFKAAGARGLIWSELAVAIDTGQNGATAAIKAMRQEKRIFASTWRYGTPAYALGDQPDAPRPVPEKLPAARLKNQRDVVAMASREVAAAHAKWAATWVPHRDPAAAWIGAKT